MREAKFHNFQVVENEPGHFLGGVVLVLLVAPIIYGLAGHPSSEVRAGAYALLLGSVFLCSSFFSHKSFLLGDAQVMHPCKLLSEQPRT